ncbi:MAG TPA: cytochrome c biogenesis protein DipZ [Dongiaceae bacterium]|nr:cytochrome c biogenesis protein DipZ [Dongiaceae bacterium]
MTLFVLAYLAGVFTIATPCILPILPFVLARADTPFRRGGLPMLLGLAFAFAMVASLAAFAGGWAVEANRYGRTIILALLMLFGLSMLFPALAERLMAPVVALGSWLSQHAERRGRSGGVAATSLLLGIATGLVWAPCAGPVLGLILSGAALRGPSLATSLLLLTYGLGAATSLAASMMLGGSLFDLVKQSARWGNILRRGLGAAVVTGAGMSELGFDTSLLTRLSAAGTNHFERSLVTILRDPREMGLNIARPAAAAPTLSGPLGSLLKAPQWLNTRPLQAGDLRGKVVLVNFWTYSCINCLRVLPHVRAWAEKYKDRGLVVIGVHTPEFAFEKEVGNVRKATALLGVDYPVAIDNDFRIWQEFDNEAWPALYFIDADGRMRRQVLGEGEYDDSERLIQQLLSEANGAAVTGNILPVTGIGPQAAADETDLYSGETYIGYAKARNFASADGVSADVPGFYRPDARLPLNWWSLGGTWTIGSEFATLNDMTGRIAYRFHARDLHLVLGPSVQVQAVRFRVTIDGAPPGTSHGSDVDAEGWGKVRDARLYQLVRQAGPVGEHIFEIEFFDAGVRAYAFTFG